MQRTVHPIAPEQPRPTPASSPRTNSRRIERQRILSGRESASPDDTPHAFTGRRIVRTFAASLGVSFGSSGEVIDSLPRGTCPKCGTDWSAGACRKGRCWAAYGHQLGPERRTASSRRLDGSRWMKAAADTRFQATAPRLCGLLMAPASSGRFPPIEASGGHLLDEAGVPIARSADCRCAACPDARSRRSSATV